MEILTGMACMEIPSLYVKFNFFILLSLQNSNKMLLIIN